MIMLIQDKSLILTGLDRVRTRKTLFSLLGVTILMCFGCSRKNEFIPPPPPPVTVAHPIVRDVIKYSDFSGKTSAIATVEIRARVQGWLEKRHFSDGQFVRRGELLFTIDPREYEAALHNAEANLLNAKTALAFAENDLARREKAFAENAISELDLLRSRSDRDQAMATVAGAEAQLEEAQINLSYCEILSPITGKTSRRLVDVGNLVGAGEATLLTTVTQIKPIYAYFNVNEREIARYLQLDAEYRAENPGQSSLHQMVVEVQLGIATEEGFPHRGILDFVDNHVDPETGTMQARAKFPNEDIRLLPGMFSNIRIPAKVLKQALLVPELTVGLDQQGHFLLVVNDKNVVERRSVELGPKEGELIVVSTGIDAGDRVIINGLLNARPGREVQPEMSKAETVLHEIDPGEETAEPESAAGSSPDTVG